MTGSSLQQLFSQAYLVGGSPCSGKSTVAEMLSAQFGLPYYKADDHDQEHMKRADPQQQPVMFSIRKQSWDEIWSQAPEKLYTDELAYYRENFSFILEDFHPLNSEKPVIFEGAAFLPDLIAAFPVQRENVIFMIPTLDFQLHHYSQRPWLQSILRECHDPKQAFENWMKRDHLFGLEVARQAKEYGFRVMIVDGSMDIPAQYETIKAQFKL